ncbi:hypothetical protein LIER_44091 [Lithospermum erythrorhizon]|uniref:FBA_2 domain-containing protein n=1 Tax=Lithospermum erythrorhizon TaxID=34254 RepID=A0AAV3PDQ8_LITER
MGERGSPCRRPQDGLKGVVFLKDIKEEIPINSVKGFAHVNFNGSKPIFFTFGVLNSLSEFLGHKNVVLSSPALHKIILEWRAKDIKMSFETVDHYFGCNFVDYITKTDQSKVVYQIWMGNFWYEGDECIIELLKDMSIIEKVQD